MKILLLTIVLVNLALSTAYFDFDKEWEAFKEKHHKKTSRSKAELEKRKQIFKENLDKINEHNAKNKGYSLGITKFTDWTEEEFNSMLRPANVPEPEITTELKPLKAGQKFKLAERSDDAEIPDFWDWREQGKVTPVKDQNPCSSCWAFGATAAIESLILIQYNQTYILSEQNLMDCVNDTYGRAYPTCQYGGWPAWAYKYIMDHGGYALDAQYPYIRETQECKQDIRRYADISGFIKITPGDEEEMKKIVYLNGPISVDVDARGFGYLKDGIYEWEGCATEQGNHIVTIVGYGSQDGRDYWIIKNSWGSDWGENGFGKIIRGKNMCAIAMHADYPVRYT